MSVKYLGGVKESFTNAVGTELCWGWSPAVDLLALIEDHDGKKPEVEVVEEPKSKNAAAAASKVEEIDEDEPAAGAGAAAASAVAEKPAPAAPAPASSSAAPSKPKKPTVVAFDEDGFPIIQEESSSSNINNNNAASATPDSSSDQQTNNNNNKSPINILLVGAADVRHIICTLSRAKRTELGRSGRPLHFYVFEPGLRVHCRHLLFLQLMLVDMVTLSELEDRVSIILEIFGNSMIREVTAGAFKNAAAAVSAAMDFEEGDETATTTAAATKRAAKSNTKLASWLDWSYMKSKEKDFVAQQLLLWTRDRTSVDIVSQWDARVRNELAERYDNRVNIFDWDFHMSLLDYSQTLRFAEYREFRKMGQAFDYCRINPRRGFRYDYTVPNKSLAMFPQRAAVAAASAGGSKAASGSGGAGGAGGEIKGVYQGDVKNGPFFAIGHSTENPNLKKREVDGTTIYGCGIIAMHTIRAWLYELVTGGAKPFPTNIEHKTAWEDEKNYNFLPEDAPEPHVEFTPQVPLDVKFSFVGLDVDRFFERIVRENCSSEDADGFFDAAFFGATSTQWMTPTFYKTMRKKGVAVAETLKFVVDANEEAKRMFESKIVDELAAAAGWRLNRELTEKLHALQMEPKKRPENMEMDAAMKRAVVRQKLNFQVVLEKGGD